MPGRDLDGPNQRGWAWKELSLVSANEGGAPLAQRDALKLMAVMLQHTDSKPEQQRLSCVDKQAGDKDKHDAETNCEHTFMLINDLGLTFGRASNLNKQGASSVNLEQWSGTPVWRDSKGCVGNLKLSNTGTLENPVISEAGRSFLAGLLTQLSDQQLRDLFEVARFPLITQLPKERAADGPVQAWVNAFKDKVAQIANRSCPAAPAVPAA